jgi:hypothetical protein
LQGLPKRPYLCTEEVGLTSHKAIILIFRAVRTSQPFKKAVTWFCSSGCDFGLNSVETLGAQKGLGVNSISEETDETDRGKIALQRRIGNTGLFHDAIEMCEDLEFNGEFSTNFYGYGLASDPISWS